MAELGVEEVDEQQVGETDLSVGLGHAPLGARETHVVAPTHRVLRRRVRAAGSRRDGATLRLLRGLQLALTQTAQHQRQLLAQRAHLHIINIHQPRSAYWDCWVACSWLSCRQLSISDSSSLSMLIYISSIFISLDQHTGTAARLAVGFLADSLASAIAPRSACSSTYHQYSSVSISILGLLRGLQLALTQTA